MKNNQPHIFLMGFKHVGKSVVGKALALGLKKEFIDLDEEVEFAYAKKHNLSRSCRQISESLGEAGFRELESLALEKTVQKAPAVIALGGGTPLFEINQRVLLNHILIHIEAPKEVVYNRIMAGGRPSFFPVDADPYVFFLQLWDKRQPVYQKLATFTVENGCAVADVVEQIMQKLS